MFLSFTNYNRQFETNDFGGTERGLKVVRKIAFFMTVACVIAFQAVSTSAFNINLVYPDGTLFSPTYDAVARNAIDAAAFDISNAITTNLAAINDDVITGTSGGTSVTFNWNYQYTDPSSGNSATINAISTPANTVTMYVGARNLSGSTLGVGGPAGAGYSVGLNYNGSGALNLASAMASAESKSELELKRGGGAVIGAQSSTVTLGGQSASFSIDFGVAYGSLALDWSGSGDGNWHFDHTTPVAAGKNDLYSVALHEILHAIGIGTSASWAANNPDGRNWTGPSVLSLVGSGTNLLNPTANHITEGTMSTDILTGASQEAVMDPTITSGKRKSLTALDLAFLRDIGYSTIDWVTESSSPADFNHDGHVNGTDLAIWQGSYGNSVEGDADNDGDTDGRDFLVWQREFTGASSLSSTVIVPEPCTIAMLGSSVGLLLSRRKKTR
jgi:hypothetical protein